MSRKTPTARASPDRANLYDDITRQIVALGAPSSLRQS